MYLPNQRCDDCQALQVVVRVLRNPETVGVVVRCINGHMATVDATDETLDATLEAFSLGLP